VGHEALRLRQLLGACHRNVNQSIHLLLPQY
jgi:hypothetical protein